MAPGGIGHHRRRGRLAAVQPARRAKVAGLSWPLPVSLDEAGLERRLFPAPPLRASRPLPDWNRLHRELRRKGVTLSLLWEEYKAVHPEGLQYSRFCEQYRSWAAQGVPCAPGGIRYLLHARSTTFGCTSRPQPVLLDGEDGRRTRRRV